MLRAGLLVGRTAILGLAGGAMACGSPEYAETSIAETAEAAFAPVSMTMIPVIHYVAPVTIVWDQPDEMYLVGNVIPGDGGGPLPTLRPFQVTDQDLVATMSYAKLSIKARDTLAWKPAFQAGRRVILTLSVNGRDEQLPVALSMQ